MGLGLNLGSNLGVNLGGISAGALYDITDYFAKDGGIIPWFQSITPPAIYDSVSNKTYMSWLAGTSGQYQMNVRGSEYNHATGAWTPSVKGFDANVNGDYHAVPSMCIDHQGYVHLFGGCHNNVVQSCVSASPRDMSVLNYNAGADNLSGTHGYPHPVLVGSTIYLFTRQNISGDMDFWVTPTATLSGGRKTWGTQKKIWTFGTATRTYIGSCLAKGTDIHCSITYADSGDTVRRDVYYVVYDTLTGALKNVDGSYSVAAASLPITAANKNNFLVYDQAATSTEGCIPYHCFDLSGNPHIVFMDGSGSAFNIKHTYWTGSVWSAPATIGTNSYRYQECCISAKSDGSMEAMWSSKKSGKFTGPNGGGTIELNTRSVGGVWGTASVIATGTRAALNGAIPVQNAHDDMRWLFSETSRNNQSTYSNLRCYAWSSTKGYSKNTFPKPVSYSSASQLISAMNVAPDSTRQALISSLWATVYGLKDKLDAFYVFAAHDKQATYLNWLGQQYPAFWVESPTANTFTANVGYLSGTNNNFMLSDFSPSEVGAKYSKDDAMLGFWSVTANTQSQVDAFAGAGVSATNAQDYVNAYSGAARINASSGGVGTAPTDSTGLFIAQRTNSTTVSLYRNTALVAQSAAASSTDLANENMSFGSYAGGTRSQRQLGAAFIGKSLTSGEMSSLYTALQTYLTAIGAI